MQVSISTALEAYCLLEDRQLIEARPQSGYYVRRLFNQSPGAGDYLSGGFTRDVFSPSND
jgi:DNA-binding transcriptional MocR family regulator